MNKPSVRYALSFRVEDIISISTHNGPAYLLYDALGIEVSQANAGGTRYKNQPESKRCIISVEGDREHAEMTAYTNGTVLLVTTNLGLGSQDWKLVKRDGSVIAATKPYNDVDGAIGRFEKQDLENPLEIALDLLARRDQALAAVQMLLSNRPKNSPAPRA